MQIPYSELKQFNPHYHRNRIQLYKDLYCGGHEFEEHKDNYLVNKDRDRNINGQSSALRRERLSNASYTPHISGIINFLAAASQQSPPGIVTGENETERALYWLLLNSNIDGYGHDLGELTRCVLIEAMVQGKAYILLDFPSQTEASSLEQQKKSGSLNITLRHVPSVAVEEWGEDERGNLTFIRIHTVEQVRENIYTAPTEVLHRWTFYTPEIQQAFTIQKKLNDPLTEEDLAAEEFKIEHNLGAVPVVRLCAPHILGQLAPLCLDIFNSEARLNFSLSQQAFSQMVMKTNRDISQVVTGESTCLLLEPEANSNIFYASPSSTNFSAQQENITTKIDNLNKCLNSLILSQPMKASAPRASGVAKQMDYSALEQFLFHIAGECKSALEKCIDLIKKARKEEDLEIKVIGLDKFDVTNWTAKLEIAERTLSLPLPPMVKKIVMRDLAATVTSNATPEERQQVASSFDDFELEKPEPSIEPIKPVLENESEPEIKQGIEPETGE